MKTEKEEVLKLRKIASTIAKEIKHFWDSVHKVMNDLVECVTLFYCHVYSCGFIITCIMCSVVSVSM